MCARLVFLGCTGIVNTPHRGALLFVPRGNFFLVLLYQFLLQVPRDRGMFLIVHSELPFPLTVHFVVRRVLGGVQCV